MAYRKPRINTELALDAWTSAGGGTPPPGAVYMPSGDETAAYTSATSTMPYQINAFGTVTNSDQPAEFEHPKTKAWVRGTPATLGGVAGFAATLSGVDAMMYEVGTLRMRIMGFPTIYTNKTAVNVTATTGGGGDTPPPSQPYTITPQTADYQENAGVEEAQSDGTVRRASLAYLEYDVAYEASVDITVKTNGSNRTVSAFLNGTELQRWVSSGAGTTTYTQSLAGTGTRRLKVVIGQGDRDYEQGDIIAPSVVNLSFAGLGSATLVKADKAEQVLGFGNSIMSGAGATNPETEAFAVLLRTANRGFAAISYGSHTGAVCFGSGGRAKALTQLSVGWAKANVVKTGLIELGTNDYDFATGNPSDYAAGIATFLDAAYAAHPTSRWWLLSPFPRLDKTGARGGYTLQQYDDALSTVVTGREQFVKRLSGPAMLPTSQLSPDGLHPSTQGHATIAAALNTAFTNRTFASAPSGPTVTPATGRPTVASGLAANWQTQIGTGLSLTGNTLTHASAADNSWRNHAPAYARVKSLPANFVGEFLRIHLPNLTRATSGITLGLSESPTVTVNTDVAGLYLDPIDLELTGGDGQPVAGYIHNYAEPIGPLFLVAAGNVSNGTGYLELRNSNNVSVAGTCPLSITGNPLYIHAFCYGNAGWDPGQQVSTIDGAIITSNYLEKAFI